MLNNIKYSSDIDPVLTKGQKAAIARSEAKKKRLEQLNSNPNRLENETDEGYRTRISYFNQKIDKTRREGVLNSAYYDMKDDQQAEKNPFVKATRQVLTSPVHVARGLADLIDANDTKQYMSDNRKVVEAIDLGAAALDVTALTNPFGITRFMLKKKGGRNIISPLAKLLAKETAEDVVIDHGKLVNERNNNKKIDLNVKSSLEEGVEKYNGFVSTSAREVKRTLSKYN